MKNNVDERENCNFLYICDLFEQIVCSNIIHASNIYKSIAGRYRPVSYPDGSITARYGFIKNAYWDMAHFGRIQTFVRQATCI